MVLFFHQRLYTQTSAARCHLAELTGCSFFLTYLSTHIPILCRRRSCDALPEKMNAHANRPCLIQRRNDVRCELLRRIQKMCSTSPMQKTRKITSRAVDFRNGYLITRARIVTVAALSTVKETIDHLSDFVGLIAGLARFFDQNDTRSWHRSGAKQCYVSCQLHSA